MIPTTVQNHNGPFGINREILTIKTIEITRQDYWNGTKPWNHGPFVTNLGQPGRDPRLKKSLFSWGICTHRKFHPSSHRIKPHGIIRLSLPGWITAAPGIWWWMRKQCTGCSWYKPLLPTSCRGEETLNTKPTYQTLHSSFQCQFNILILIRSWWHFAN